MDKKKFQKTLMLATTLPTDLTAKLKKTIPVEEFVDKAIVEYLQNIYELESLEHQCFAAIMNSAFYHGYPNFIITRTSLMNLIKNDVNLTRISFNTTNYNEVILKLTHINPNVGFPLLKIVVPQTGKKPGFLEVAEPEAVSIMQRLLFSDTYEVYKEQRLERFYSDFLNKDRLKINKDAKTTIDWKKFEQRAGIDYGDD